MSRIDAALNKHVRNFVSREVSGFQIVAYVAALLCATDNPLRQRSPLWVSVIFACMSITTA